MGNRCIKIEITSEKCHLRNQALVKLSTPKAKQYQSSPNPRTQLKIFHPQKVRLPEIPRGQTVRRKFLCQIALRVSNERLQCRTETLPWARARGTELQERAV